MRTVLYSTLYLNGSDLFGNNRLERTVRYLDYYHSLKDRLGFDKVVFADNVSDYELISQLIDRSKSYVSIHRYREHIPRLSVTDYGYCWRGVWDMKRLIDEGYEKIITIDTDAFILTSRMADWVRDLKDGWSTVWCNRYNFPESALHVLCKPAFPLFEEMIKKDWRTLNGKVFMESTLPYKVEYKFNSDRWGETKTPQDVGMDLYCQCPLGLPLKFDMSNQLDLLTPSS
jgi:hypothetical protein